MRTHTSCLWLLSFLLLAVRPAHAAPTAGDVETTKGGPLTVRPLTHGSVLFQWRGRAIYVDPAGNYDWASLPKADLILITQEHPDHCSPDTVAKIRKRTTLIVANPNAARQLPGAGVMRNGTRRDYLGIGVRAVPAYNMVRKAPDGQFYHPKGRDNGYILAFADKRVYLAGDTEAIPEMAKLGRVDIAFLPINLPYTMPPAEAAKAARMIHPRILYPYHQGQSNPNDLKKALASQKGTETGVVKWFNDAKGYGFIQADNGQDVFVHYSGITSAGGNRTLTEGQRVQFNVVQERGKKRASNVTVLHEVEVRVRSLP